MYVQVLVAERIMRFITCDNKKKIKGCQMITFPQQLLKPDEDTLTELFQN